VACCISDVIHYYSLGLWVFSSTAFIWPQGKKMYFYFKMCNCFSGTVYEVMLGANRLDDVDENGAEAHLTTSSIVHSQYNADTINNDIAVVQLSSAISFSSEYCHILMNVNIVSLHSYSLNQQVHCDDIC
jgi:hypothetical protein